MGDGFTKISEVKAMKQYIDASLNYKNFKKKIFKIK